MAETALLERLLGPAFDLLTGAGPLAVVSAAVWTGALGVALRVGRWLETRLAGPAP